MMPVFANPLGFWALLGVPVILAIHFLQQRARTARTSTWFLIERLAPDSAQGRTWDRIRASRRLFLQLLAVLVGTWVLVEPRWVRSESAQTVALVLDASASMSAFRAPAMEAADFEMNLAEGLAARTTWVVMTTNPRQPPLYRGEDRAAAVLALARWQPDLGQHDFGPALRLANGMTAKSGRTLLITDQRGKTRPDLRTAGVGSPIENVGFAGASVARTAEGVVWRTLVKNHASVPQSRRWHVVTNGGQSAESALELAPGALVELSARLPDGVDQATVVLSPDGFSMDDRLPLVRPAPKPLSVWIDGDDEAAQFFRKLTVEVDGVTLVSGGNPARLRLARVSAEEIEKEASGGIYWPPANSGAKAMLSTDPVTSERDELVAGLNWQGWFGAGSRGYAMKPGDTALLWQGNSPLVFMRTPDGETALPSGARVRKLLLAFDWSTTNASRLPAMVLLARRFIEAERDVQPAPYAANFDAHGTIALNGAMGQGIATAGGPLQIVFQPADGGAAETRLIQPAEWGDVRAPGRPGFFSVKRGEENAVKGAAHFADARQGDFRAAERFFQELPTERRALLESNTRGDPLAAWWLVALAAMLLGSWWVRQSGASPEQTGSGTGENRVGKKISQGTREPSAGRSIVR